MGNQLCCQQGFNQPSFLDMKHKYQQRTNDQNYVNQNERIPQISEQISAKLTQLKAFKIQFQEQQKSESYHTKRFGKDIYYGPLDSIGRPTKFGKMYKQNGGLFIGQFVSGKAQGSCYYFMKDGSFYQGLMKQNIAECQNGKYITAKSQYQGGFKNNNFHGKGTQKLKHSSNYVFDGIYQNGIKKSGLMKWTQNNQQYIYQGQLNEKGQFTKKGKLTDSNGIYEGTFLNGIKHGEGTYYYNTKIRYQGQYVHNQKQGRGILYNADNTVAYKGLFKNGLPNGKGTATKTNGQVFETQWKDGIDVRLL